MWLYHEIHFTATDPTQPTLPASLSTPRRVGYRFKAWQICRLYVIIEIVKKIHNNVRTDKTHTLPHTHTQVHVTYKHLLWVCVYKNQMVYCDNTCQKITTDEESRQSEQDQEHDYKILCSEVKLTLWASIKVPLLIEIIAKFCFYKISTNNEYSAVYSSEIFKNFHIFYLPIESSLAFCLKRNLSK